jgi:hypothetical protein
MDDKDVYPFQYNSLTATLHLFHYKIVQIDHDINNRQPVHYFHPLGHREHSLLQLVHHL